MIYEEVDLKNSLLQSIPFFFSSLWHAVGFHALKSIAEPLWCCSKAAESPRSWRLCTACPGAAAQGVTVETREICCNSLKLEILFLASPTQSRKVRGKTLCRVICVWGRFTYKNIQELNFGGFLDEFATWTSSYTYIG